LFELPAVLATALGDASPGSFAIVDSVSSKITRPFTTTTALAEEQRIVRMWGGIFSQLAGSE
jgi:hypothetical protein